MATAITVVKKGATSPWGAGRRRLGDEDAFSRRTSWEPVARMVMVRQVSSTVTPSAFRGTGKCSTVGPSVGSS